MVKPGEHAYVVHGLGRLSLQASLTPFSPADMIPRSRARHVGCARFGDLSR